MLKCGKDHKQLQQYVQNHREELNQLDTVELTALQAMLGMSETYLNKLTDTNPESKGADTMCEALKQLREEGRMEGIAQGKAEGIVQGQSHTISAFIQDYLRDGLSVDMIIQNLERIFSPSPEEKGRFYELIRKLQSGE